MTNKRKRHEQASWWSTLEGDIVTHGGFLHPSIGFSEESRTLEVVDPVVPDESDATVDKNVATEAKDQGVVMMRIPKATMITLDLAVTLLAPWWPTVKESMHDLQASHKFYSSLWDVLLALALAYVVDSPATMSREDQIARAYLATLPPDSRAYFEAVPWRWSEQDLEDSLGGSPLLTRARQTQQGIQRDYSCIVKAFHSSHSGKNAISGPEEVVFPVSLGTYCDMMVVVSSRAFVIDTTDAHQQPEVALIPILDLCDHCRGGQDNKAKNLSYTIQDDCMIVRTTNVGSPALLVGETLRLTYGAKSNADLLLHYGFAIPVNLEPDGSSNDILEWPVVPAEEATGTSSNECLIRLRTGPKSYTYGCLVKALALFQSSSKESSSSPLSSLNANTRNEMDDMEAFLHEDGEGDEDEDDDPEDDGDVDLYDEISSPGETMNVSDDDGEVLALEKFGKAIQDRLGAYSLGDSVIENLLTTKKQDAEYYSALLIHAEKRTLHFIATVVQKILARLQKDDQVASDQDCIRPSQLFRDSLAEAQIDELVEAYMIIRHSKET